MSRRLTILYLSHNSIGTPLVRSQVLPHLRELRLLGVESHLMTFERGGPTPVGEFDPARWTSLRARRGSGLSAKIVDAVAGSARALILVLRHRPTLIHARSYLSAAIAAVVGSLTRRPFIFDMRGFLGEEHRASGHWSAGDLRLRILTFAEVALLRASAATVVLTDVAERRLRSEPRFRDVLRDKPIVVVPCAVDLRMFTPLAERAARPTLVFSGTLAGWYLLDEMLEVFEQARVHVPELRFLFLNRDERRRIESAIAARGLTDSDAAVTAVDFSAMPQALGRCHVGIVFSRPARSIGASPIKVAEYLACGLPVVVNAELGDVDQLVSTHGAGHVVRSLEPQALREAGDAVAALVHDEAARVSARRLAESAYDVRVAASRYVALYARLAGTVRSSRAASGE